VVVIWFEFVFFDSVSFITVIGRSVVGDCACKEGFKNKLKNPHTLNMIVINIRLNLSIAMIHNVSKYKTIIFY
jgi:hypothetical protein